MGLHYGARPGPADSRFCPTQARPDETPFYTAPATDVSPLNFHGFPKKCKSTQSVQAKLFCYTAIINCADYGFKLRSPVSLTGTKATSTEPLL